MSRSSRDEQSACSDGEALRRRLRELEERLQQRDAELDALRSARPDPDQKPDLHDKLRLLQRAVEQSPVSVVITDARGDIQYVNPHFTTLTGYTREEALGRNPRILKSDRQPRSFYRELWQTITAGQDWSGEFCNLKKNGEEYWEQATISPVKNDSGKIAHFLAVKEDVTEKRRALLQLRESEERFRQIVEGTDNIVTRVDAQGRYLYLNTAAQELFGPQARLGDLAFENVHPEDQDETMRAYGRWLDRQTPRIRFENRVLSSQGEPRNIHWTISFQFDENGRLEYATSIGHDITDLRQLQRLRDDVDRITRHDLKGPLLGIISVPQLLMEEENITTEQRTLLKAMEEAGYHMLRLINLSLDIYKIETGVYRLHPRRVDLHSVLRRVVSEVCRGFLHRSIEVHRADLDAHSDAGGTAEAPPSPDTPYPVFGEELLCHSLLANLLRNALDATPENQCTRVTLRPGDPARVEIHNPLAVPPKVRAHFFEKYITAGKPQGTGLGTYSALLLTRVQNGELRMETSDQTGTTLHLQLPRPPQWAK
ncbi:MAG: PAS domain S-box protein [Desulfovibrio sp.]|jgi:PAS domain S-box-containing protein|nr:PAS domain S-box protein [Desulfovibrio sp.]